MKKGLALSEFFAGIISLFFIGAVSIAAQYNTLESGENYERTDSVEYFTWELKEFLNLTERQELAIRDINYDFYDKVSQAKEMYSGDGKKINREIDVLILNRNVKVLELLNRNQKQILRDTEFFVLAKKENN
jgi:hypothetical protein